MKKSVLIIGTIVLAIVGAFLIYRYVIPTNTNGQSKKFNAEYTLLDENNVFVYKSVDEIINVLEKGTGIVFFGFPECPWCQQYVVYLNELAKSHNIKEIYYYNIRSIRNDNTDKYKKIVSLIEKELPLDDSGNKRVMVPNVTFVKNGKILANDNETGTINTKIEISEYWTTEKIEEFKNKMNNYFDEYTGACSTCN